MEEESLHVEDYFRNKFKTNKWLTYQLQSKEYKNTVYVNQDFYTQHRNMAKNFRCNKKISHRAVQPHLEKADSEKGCRGFTSGSADLIYETAIPNTVRIFSFEF